VVGGTVAGMYDTTGFLSPLSVTDCERPPITLIVSAQSLKEHYDEITMRTAKMHEPSANNFANFDIMSRSHYQTPTRTSFEPANGRQIIQSQPLSPSGGTNFENPLPASRSLIQEDDEDEQQSEVELLNLEHQNSSNDEFECINIESRKHPRPHKLMYNLVKVKQ
jgi:hypothetical protein